MDPWDGQLYDVRLWSGARQAATIRKLASVLPARCNAFLGPSSPPCYAVVNRGKQRFPSLRINAPLRCEGKAYFEATIRSSGCIQVGEEEATMMDGGRHRSAPSGPACQGLSSSSRQHTKQLAPGR